MIPRIRKLAIAVLAALAFVLAFGRASTALAGTVSVSDRAHLFSGADERRLAAAARELPFDVRLVTSTANATRADFDDELHALVTSPRLVVFGVDPEHHYAIVHVGTATGVAPSQAHAIAEEGAARFKAHDWVGGAVAMMERSGELSTGARGAAPIPVQRSSSGVASFGALLLLVIGGVVVAAIVIAVIRSRRQEPAYYGSPPGPQGPALGGGYGGYGGYGPVPGPGPLGGGGGIGTHLGAAALGGLAGYELGKLAGEREEREIDRERYVDRGGFVDDDRDGRDDGNYDAGGGSADWSDDGGGSGGGGFDGGDSGGGGSDW